MMSEGPTGQTCIRLLCGSRGHRAVLVRAGVLGVGICGGGWRRGVPVAGVLAVLAGRGGVRLWQLHHLARAADAGGPDAAWFGSAGWLAERGSLAAVPGGGCGGGASCPKSVKASGGCTTAPG